MLALLRNPSYCAYAGGWSKALRDVDAAERRFEQLSIEERSKFEKETFSNVTGITRREKTAGKEATGASTMMN